jgi:tetratricopeptide (TPR) repeat protein
MLAESMTRLSFSLVPAALVLLSSTAAFAQTDLERATARDAANSGRAAFEAGQYEKAIDQFTRAEQLVHAPPHLLYLARAQAKLGKLVAAHETYLKITRETLKPNAPKAFSDAQGFAEQELAAVDARLPYVTVTLQGAPADGVSIDMDGTLLPSAMIGIPLPTDPGQHVFKATGTATSEPVTVRIAEAAKQSVVLKAHPVATAAPVKPVAPVAAPAAGTSEPPLDEGSHGTSGLRVASYVSFGVGAIGLGLGTVFLLKAKSTDDEAGKLFDQCAAVDPGGNCGPDRDKYEAKNSDANSQRSIGITSMIAGGVGVAAGVTFLILDASNSSKSARRTEPHVTPVFGFNSVGLVGAF